jgi:16S rRNA (uracil1498-N3)-methyltransferase
MRAVFIQNIVEENSFRISGDAFHHLVNVIRIQAGEEILVLNGKGLKLTAMVENISKKDLVLKEISRSLETRPYLMDLALGIPKRDALELCLREATELGIRRLYLVESDYSNIKIPEIDRLIKIMISSVEQSNSSFIPEVIQASWINLPWDDYGYKVIMDSRPRSSKNLVPVLSSPNLLIVGPEGGFSKNEINYFDDHQLVDVLHLPTPILRTPTAVATGSGWLLQRLLDCR